MIRLNALALLAVAWLLSGCSDRNAAPRVAIETPLGCITAEICEREAPVTAVHFLELVDEGVYNGDGAGFYRVVRPDNQPGDAVRIEVIQGGVRGSASAKAIPHETTAVTGLHHLDGSLSMARAEPGTASSEFFICLGDQPELDFGGRRNPDGQGFAVFGRVVDGMDVVRAIQSREDRAQYLTEPVTIRSIRRIR